MRARPDQAFAVIDTVVNRATSRVRSLPDKEFLSAMESLRELADPSAIPYVAMILGEALEVPLPPAPGIIDRAIASFGVTLRKPARQEKLVAACARTLSELVLRAPPWSLLQVDQCLRSWRLGYRYTPAQLARLIAHAGDERAVVGLLAVGASHPDGQVRERMLRALDQHPCGDALRFILLRTVDWVEPIRNLAVSMVKARFDAQNVAQLIDALPLIARIAERKRGRSVQWTGEAYEFLRRPEHVDALLAALEHRDRRTRREAFDLLSHSTSLAPGVIVESAMAEADTLIRVRGFEFACDRLQGESLYLLLCSALTDRNARIRDATLDQLHGRFPERSAAHLERALFDSSTWVRYSARFYLEKLGRAEFLPAYRAAVATAGGPELVGAIGGLQELGNSDDVALLTPLLEHPLSKVVRAALQAIAKLEPARGHELALERLRDRRPGVVREAAAIARRRVSTADADRLLGIAASAASPKGRQEAVRLLAALSGWPALIWLLRAVLVDDPSRTAERELVRWESASRGIYRLPAPGRESHDMCWQELEEARVRLPAELVARIEAALRSAKDGA